MLAESAVPKNRQVKCRINVFFSCLSWVEKNMAHEQAYCCNSNQIIAPSLHDSSPPKRTCCPRSLCRNGGVVSTLLVILISCLTTGLLPQSTDDAVSSAEPPPFLEFDKKRYMSLCLCSLFCSDTSASTVTCWCQPLQVPAPGLGAE